MDGCDRTRHIDCRAGVPFEDAESLRAGLRELEAEESAASRAAKTVAFVHFGCRIDYFAPAAA